MSLAALADAAAEHARQLDEAERALQRAQEAFEASGEAARQIARLAIAEDLSAAWRGDWVSSYGATQIEQLIARLKACGLRRDLANFRAVVATKSERVPRSKGKPA